MAPRDGVLPNVQRAIMGPSSAPSPRAANRRPVPTEVAPPCRVANAGKSPTVPFAVDTPTFANTRRLTMR